MVRRPPKQSPSAAQSTSPGDPGTDGRQAAREPLSWKLVVKIGMLLGALGIAAGLYLFPLPVGLSPQGRGAIAVFVVAVSLWMTGLIPLAATSLGALAALPALGALPTTRAFALFGNTATFFILGVFLLAGAMIHTGLSKRLTVALLSRLGNSPRRLAAGVMITAGVLSFVMPEHAVAAMMFPIVMEIAKALRLRPHESEFGRMLFLSLAWGAVTGGVGTLVGGARAPLAIEILREETGTSIDFMTWMWMAAPIAVLLLGIAVLVLQLAIKPEPVNIELARRALLRQLVRLGPVSKAEYKVIGIVIVTICLWIASLPHIGIASTALLAVVALFALRAVRWKDVEGYVNWSIVLMYGGAVAVGVALSETGAVSFVVERILRGEIPSPILAAVILTVLTMLVTEGVSNTAAVAILLPLGIALAGRIGLDPVMVTYLVAITAGLPFLLPISAPPHVICYSSGYYGILKMMRPGVYMSVVSLVVIILVSLLYWPIFGVHY